MIAIRPEKPEDLPLIYSVIEHSFKRTVEATLVDKLRQACNDCLSMVAEENGTIVGHIMFTPLLVKNGKEAQGMGLAPMAVLPARQRQGIGTLLVESGLQILREKGCPFVIVLGHPEYYPRFGFQPASGFNIRSQWKGVPDEAFMVLFLDNSALGNMSGVTTFREEFNETL